MRVHTALLPALLLSFASVAHAGTTGKIAGTLRSTQAGEGVVAATVQLEGTKIGAFTDERGEFFILNLQPGDYTLIAHAIGFRDAELTRVHITPDFTTTVELTMEEVGVSTTSPILVEGKRPLMQRDATSTVRILDS